MVEIERLVVAAGIGERKIDADHRHFLGAGKQPRIGAAGRAGRDGLRIEQIVGLIGLLAAGFAGREARMHLASVSGNNAAAQYLSVKPSQTSVTSQLQLLLVVDLLVGFFLLALIAHHADQAFMQDVVALHLRRAVARDQRVGKQRDRRAALVLHFVLDGEQIMVVDRDGAAEDQAVAIVVIQRHRMIGRQRAAAFLRPHRVGSRHLFGRAGRRHEAEFGVISAPALPTARTARSPANSDRRSRGIARATDCRCARPSDRCCR